MTEESGLSPGHIQLMVNGREVAVTGGALRRLADVLRDDLGLTGTKIGCNAGDCGACTVLIDSAAACACLVPVGQIAGARVTTIEGLATDPLGARLQQSFVAHGATQCGICTPGMIMAARELIARSPRPDRGEVEDALGGVLCRCTGYEAIVDAVIAAVTQDAVSEPLMPVAGGAIGASIAKVDGEARVTGRERYGADGIPTDALHVRVIRSPHAHARFRIGDLDQALARHPGIGRILTARDIPANGHGVYPTIKDQPVLADGLVRFRGEAVLALIGEASAIAKIGEHELPIAYEPLPSTVGIDAARADDAPRVHAGKPGNVLADGSVTSGDVAGALGTSPHVVDFAVETSFVEHAYIEPEAGYAVRIGDTIELHVSTQTPYQHRDETALVLGLAKEQVRLIPTACGGGFGGKLDLNVHPLVALGALLTHRPVAYVYSRPESMAATTKRHPARVRVRLGATDEGRITAFESHAELDTGAYASWGPTVANRVPVHAPGPYVVPHARTRGTAYFTHAPPSGAFRGFGVPQSAIASEAALDMLADRLGMDWLEIRRRNALKAGDVTITGQRLDSSVGLLATIDAVEPYWRDWSQAATAYNQGDRRQRRGVGIACSWYGIGNTSLSNPSEMEMGVDTSGHVTLYCGAVDIGQGSNTILAQIAADALGVPVATIALVTGDTALTRDAGKTSASRQTLVSGKAAELAGRDLRARLFAVAGAPDGLEADPASQLSLANGEVVVASANAHYRSALPPGIGNVVTGLGRFDPPTTPLDHSGQGNPYSAYAFATQVALVEVDLDLATTRVLEIAAAHDVGRAINPQQVIGQIQGGIAQGLGLALMEEYVPGRTENLHDYLIPTFGDMPRITALIVEAPTPHGPSGAKGVGEPALISTAPAIYGAIFKATGVRVTKAPALPHRLLAAMRQRG
ncbi:MAG TPA: molybdopterin-dependent oxidoreductase [Hyphomicrobiaceae bacterium]|nr:molybdopterin-dependent oxidoreductase [Hyphomicrobiaceae bacterium]